MIKEFDLDAPFEKRIIRQKFRMQTRCVTRLFERGFTPPKTPKKAWKILVQVVPSVSDRRILDLLGVITVQIESDVVAFGDLPAPEKKETALKWLWEGVCRIVGESGWDITPYEKARKFVLDSSFRNEWYWDKHTWDRSKSIQIKLYVVHDVEKMALYAHLFDKKGQRLKEIYILSDLPDEFIFSRYFGSFRWKNDTCVCLVAKDGSEYSEINIHENDS